MRKGLSHIVLATAALSIGAVMASRLRGFEDTSLVRDPVKRDEEVAPYGPEVSRQQRRKIERQQMKRSR